jgi:hypothetical protein
VITPGASLPAAGSAPVCCVQPGTRRRPSPVCVSLCCARLPRAANFCEVDTRDQSIRLQYYRLCCLGVGVKHVVIEHCYHHDLRLLNRVRYHLDPIAYLNPPGGKMFARPQTPRMTCTRVPVGIHRTRRASRQCACACAARATSLARTSA